MGELRPLGNPLEIGTQFQWIFIMGLPLFATKKNAIWVIVDRLTKSAYFLPTRDIWDVERLAHLYVKKIVRLHIIPANIVSDRDKIFQSRLWQAL